MQSRNITTLGNCTQLQYPELQSIT